MKGFLVIIVVAPGGDEGPMGLLRLLINEEMVQSRALWKLKWEMIFIHRRCC